MPDLRKYVCEHAVQHDNKAVLEWAIENKFKLTFNVMATAASKGDIKTLKYLHENNCPINQWATTEAAGNGHFTALCWLYSNGYPLEIYALYDSIANRHIEIVCWLLQKGCPMDDDIIFHAKEHGVDLIKLQELVVSGILEQNKIRIKSF